MVGWTIVLVSLWTLPSHAQQRELTQGDQLALLYAPQLEFTPSGDPRIRVGLVQDRDAVTFTPSHPIRVMPRGDEGAEIRLPGQQTYRLEISEAEPGRYKHWVVVKELTMDQRERQSEIVETWSERGFEPKTFQVGGLFGIRGDVFDSRVSLVCVGGTTDRGDAYDLRDRLERQHGISARVHSDVTEMPRGLFTLTAEESDVRIRHRNVLWIGAAPEHRDDIEYRIPEIPVGRGDETETRTYGGRLVFAPDPEGTISVINELSAERLLEGVVPSEIQASAPKAALRAQAIAARNTIFSSIGVRNLASPYMLRSDIYDQVYKGLDARHPRTSQAVEATRGEVMFHGKRIIEAVYSANAGGFTEDNENVWNAEPRSYLRGRPDGPEGDVPEAFRDGLDGEDELEQFIESDFPAYSRSAPVSSSNYYRWERSVDASEVREWLREHDRGIGPIRDAEVASRGVSGRAIRLKLTGTEERSTVVERELNIRRLFDHLKSGLFTMELRDNEAGHVETFEFRGAGYGHGVGMCQTGSIGMADRGRSYREILNHYYRNIEIERLY
jgi:SpoIID/LytB domain protein